VLLSQKFFSVHKSHRGNPVADIAQGYSEKHDRSGQELNEKRSKYSLATRRSGSASMTAQNLPETECSSWRLM
jgi:hypothetical protein